MLGSRISRWTMLHFGAALAVFVLAQALMVAGWAYPTAPILGTITLVTVHLLTIGWLTVLMFGALHQFVPVLTGKPATAQASALLSLLAIEFGLAAMVVGFVALGGHLPWVIAGALPLGGLLILIGIILAAARLVVILCRARPLNLPGRFVLAGLGFLVLTAGLGLTFAAILAFPALFPWSGLLAPGLKLHIMAGLLGWFSLTALGVSYRLLSMFMLAPENRGGLGQGAFLLASGGLLVTWLAGLAQAIGIPSSDLIVGAGESAAGFGFACYLADMVRLYRARRRRALELNSTAAVASLVALAISLAFIVALEIAGRLEDFAGPVGYLVIFGWLSGLALSQLHKIIPFLTWIERYGSRLGKGKVPRVQDLVEDSRVRPWFILYFAAVAIGTAFGLLNWAELWRFAVVGHFVATIAITCELWHARYGEPRQTRSTRLDSSPPTPSMAARHAGASTKGA